MSELYRWKADEQMRVNDCGEHWCIWAVDADGKLAHTEPIATVWNYLHPGRQNADLIEQAPDLLADNARLRALNAELVAVCKISEEALCEATFAEGAQQRSLNYAVDKCRAIAAKVKAEGSKPGG